jgi:hypothetical protein
MESAELLQLCYGVIFPCGRRSLRSHLLLLLLFVLLLFLCRPFPFLAATHTVGYGRCRAGDSGCAGDTAK